MKIKYIWYDIKQGIPSIFRWLPIIWRDRDWDWCYLAEMMEYKLRRMSKGFGKWGHHLYAERDAKKMFICAELLKRLRLDEWDDLDNSNVLHTSDYVMLKRHEARMNYYQEYLGHMLGKHLRSWWD